MGQESHCFRLLRGLLGFLFSGLSRIKLGTAPSSPKCLFLILQLKIHLTATSCCRFITKLCQLIEIFWSTSNKTPPEPQKRIKFKDCQSMQGVLTFNTVLVGDYLFSKSLCFPI